MDAGRRLLSPSPSPPLHPMLPRTHIRSSSISSVPVVHDQAKAVSHVPSTSVVRHFPASVLSKEHRDDYRHTSFIKEDKFSQQSEPGRSWPKEESEEKEKYDLEQYVKHLEHRFPHQPGLLYPFLLSHDKEGCVQDKFIQDDRTIQSDNVANFFSPADVLALAKRAVMATKQVASFVEESNFTAEDFTERHATGFDYVDLTKEIFVEENVIFRSKRSLERRSKKRKVSKNPQNYVGKGVSSIKKGTSKKIENGLVSNDPLRLFLWGPETKQLLTVKEEKELFLQIQELMRLEEVQQRLQFQFGREPTLGEWAEAVGMSCQVLTSHISSGQRSRDKMIYSNFRLVVHVARKYEGKGLHIQDLLQEGSRGLMKSLQKFKPKAGCRFPTYAYWWIRQSIRKAIFQHSRSIRLPENVFALLKTIKNARSWCARDGNLPTNKEIAKYAGVTVSKLESLLRTSRRPLSIQERVWSDHDVLFQEITADPSVDVPDIVLAKQMMRQHIHNLLRILKPRDRQILDYRFGIHDGKRRTLTEIGLIYGLSKERVRQLESRALDQLKECFPDEEQGVYLDLLTRGSSN